MTTIPTLESHEAAQQVLRYRDAGAALRGIARNRGRTAATTNAVARHHLDQAMAVAVLMDGDHKEVVGLLVAEQALRGRLVGSPARPELYARLRATTAHIVALVQEVGK